MKHIISSLLISNFRMRIAFTKRSLPSSFIIFIPFIVFTFLLVPFLSLPACNDAGTEYSKSTTFYGLGLDGYLHAGSLHPPFKPFVASVFYALFGQNIITYHLVGLVIGYIGILGIYLLCKNLFNKNVGLIAALLLSTFPLFVANSLDNYTDFFVAVFIILSFYFYSKNNMILYALVGSLTVLSKDTGLLLPAAIFLIEAYSLFLKKRGVFSGLVRIAISLIPICAYFVWYMYVKTHGVEVFNEYIFAETGEKGAIATILYNFFTINFFHDYARKHFFQLLYLNFNWVYWIIIAAGFIGIARRAKLVEATFPLKDLKIFFALTFFFVLFGIAGIIFQILLVSGNTYVSLNFNWVFWPLITIVFLYAVKKIRLEKIKPIKELNNPKTKTILAIFLYFMLYLITVVTFQIWDTPRYNLPLIPILIIGASYFIQKFIAKLPLYLVLLLSMVNFAGLFFSVDPISTLLWNRGSASGQTFYTINPDFLGDDALVYNLQYLLAMKKRAVTFTSYSTKVCQLNN